MIDDPWVQELAKQLGIELNIQTNRDLRPTQQVATIAAAPGGGLQQLDTQWGIRPSWANKLLINAQATKPTFRQAFAERGCLVPCSGFYEWRDEGGPRKQKYLFSAAEGQPLLMSAIWYPAETSQIVTLTQDALPEFAQYHHRFPVFLPVDSAREWVSEIPVGGAVGLLSVAGGGGIRVSRA